MAMRMPVGVRIVVMVVCMAVMIMRVVMASRMTVAASMMSMRSLDGAIGHGANPLSEHGAFHTLKLL